MDAMQSLSMNSDALEEWTTACLLLMLDGAEQYTSHIKLPSRTDVIQSGQAMLTNGTGHDTQITDLRLLCCRVKREDACPTCIDVPTASRMLLDKIIARDECGTMNIMICKSCTAHSLLNVTFHAWERDFEVWCFGEGLLKNEASFWLTLHKSEGELK